MTTISVSCVVDDPHAMTVEQLVYNAPLTTEMFKLDIPEGYKTNELK